MGIWGMIIRDAAGFAFGGPIGGLLGAGAVIAVKRDFSLSEQPENISSSRKIALTVTVIALSAKMAKADGFVTRDEISAFHKRVHIPQAEVSQVDKFWDLARQTPDDFEGPTPYEVLGVSSDIWDADLRSHWRESARTNHLDKLIADGMPVEFIKVATGKLAKINADYDTIARERGIG